ncbi:MAG TPA: UDP-3-O-(3-hydroxymyristoyl)glucosamine N-acyltransferase [Candidatus Polarisedimenticolia bacterium]|nr:UDP-3-O-(3-hydroxymyristoyl)glucosamine N-acyltransferase [Candidatus Polarisedimenticolia bacterium]
MPRYSLSEIAARVGGEVRGDPSRPIAGVQPLDSAGPDDLSFLAHPRYRAAAAKSHAAALLVRRGEEVAGRDLLLVEQPYTALAAVIGLFHPTPPPRPGVHPLASVDPAARLGRDVSVGPFAVVGAMASIGDRAALLPGAVVGVGAAIGADTVLHPGVVVYAGCVVGDRVLIHAGAVIGSDGFGFGEDAGGRAKIPQVGIVRVEDDVEIGAGTTIDRATFGSTVIGQGSRIDNLVQVGHNVRIGPGSVLVAQSGIAGSTTLGAGAILAGQAGVAGHLRVGARAVVGAKSAALADVADGAFVVGHPAVDHREWKRAQAALRRLPDLLRRLQRLEAQAEADAPPTAAAGGARPRRAKGIRAKRTRRAGRRR